MSDPREKARQKAKGKSNTTTKDKRIQVVTCAGDDSLSELVDAYVEGKQLHKTANALYGKARRIYNHVRHLLIQDRRAERPKQYVFGSGDKVCKVTVKEGGYGRLDVEAYDEVKELVGEEWAKTYITESIVASIDFSMVPKEKEAKVFEVLDKLNGFIGAKPKTDKDGEPEIDEDTGEQVTQDFVEYNVGYKPNSMFHEARAGLTSEIDADLDELTPVAVAFGR
jgi:hypothetical protein